MISQRIFNRYLLSIYFIICIISIEKVVFCLVCTYSGSSGLYSDLTKWDCLPSARDVVISSNVTVTLDKNDIMLSFSVGKEDGSVVTKFIIPAQFTLTIVQFTNWIYNQSILEIKNQYQQTNLECDFTSNGNIILTSSKVKIMRFSIIGPSSSIELYDSLLFSRDYPHFLNGAKHIYKNSTVRINSLEGNSTIIGPNSEMRSTSSFIIHNQPINVDSSDIKMISSEYYTLKLNVSNSSFLFQDSQRIQFNQLSSNNSTFNLINTISCIQREYPTDITNDTFYQIYGQNLKTYEVYRNNYIGSMEMSQNSVFKTSNTTFILSEATLAGESSSFEFNDGGSLNIMKSSIVLSNTPFKVNNTAFTIIDTPITSTNNAIISFVNINGGSVSFGPNCPITSDGELLIQDVGSFNSSGVLSVSTLSLLNVGSLNIDGTLLSFNQLNLISNHFDFNFTTNGNRRGGFNLDNSTFINQYGASDSIDLQTLSLSQSIFKGINYNVSGLQVGLFNSTIIIGINQSLQLLDSQINPLKPLDNIHTNTFINDGSLILYLNDANHPDTIIVNNGYLEIGNNITLMGLRQINDSTIVNNNSIIRFNFNMTFKSNEPLIIQYGGIGGSATIETESLLIGSNASIGLNISSQINFNMPVHFDNSSLIIAVLESNDNHTHYNFVNNVTIPSSKLLIKINRSMFKEQGTYTIMSFNSSIPNFIPISFNPNDTNIVIFDSEDNTDEIKSPQECNVVLKTEMDRVIVSFDQCEIGEAKKLSSGAIAGIVIGGIVFLCGIGGTGYYVKKRRNQVAKENSKARFASSQQITDSKV